jgi:NADPH:quinone reductase
VASGDDGVALARRLGADEVVNGRKDDVLAAAFEFAPGGLDAALVTVGGETAERSLRAIRSSGRIAVPNGVVPVPVAPSGAVVSSYDADITPAGTDRLNAIIEASSFEVHVARTFPLERVQDAHRALNDHYVGKLALKVGTGTP